MVNEHIFILALSLVPGIGPTLTRRLLNHFGTAQNIFNSNKPDIIQLGISRQAATTITSHSTVDAAEIILKKHESFGAKSIFISDNNYPKRMRNLPDPPLHMFVLGNFDFEYKQSVGVVGTRTITEYGRKAINHLLLPLEGSGTVVVSGLALGVDYEAHKKALDIGLPTVAVMATSIDEVYPADHQKLAERIVEMGGAVLSEYPMGIRTERHHFPARNRITAGLSDAVVVIEAGKRSGALITADIANSYGREVFALPGSIFSKTSTGCHEIIKNNTAQAITTGYDLVDFFKASMQNIATQANIVFDDLTAPNVDDDSLEGQIFKFLNEKGSATIDQLAWAIKMNTGPITALLIELELTGKLKALPGNRFAIKK